MAKKIENLIYNEEEGEKPLYPAIDSRFKVKKNNNLFKMNTAYIITGFGLTKEDNLRNRKKFWEVLDMINMNEDPIHISKSDLNKMYDSDLLIDISIPKEI